MRQLVVQGRRMVIGPAALERIIDLRHAELRTGLPREAARWSGDHDPATRHFGVFDGEAAVGCATLLLNEWEGEPAYMLRGMAVRADVQGLGIGAALLRYIEASVRRDGDVALLWCNARIRAAPFYERHGWVIASDVFEVPAIGPHCRMIRRLR